MKKITTKIVIELIEFVRYFIIGYVAGFILFLIVRGFL